METEELLHPCVADLWKWIADGPAVHFLYSDLVAFVWGTIVKQVGKKNFCYSDRSKILYYTVLYPGHCPASGCERVRVRGRESIEFIFFTH